MTSHRLPTLSSLRLFLQVSRSRSFTETARLFNVSQPALSRAIRLLEEQLGQRLFDRDTRNVALTAAGEGLLPIVERLTADFDSAFAELNQSFAGKRGRVVVGALPSICAIALPRALASFLEDHAEVDILIRDDLSGTLYQNLVDRQIDFAITMPPDQDGFAFAPLYSDPFVLVCPRDDPLMEVAKPPWAVFASRPYIALARPSSVRILADAALMQAGASAPPLFECAHISTLAGLIDARLGISALPSSCLPLLHRDTIGWRELDEPVTARAIGIAHLEARALSPTAAALKRHLVAELEKPR